MTTKKTIKRMLNLLVVTGLAMNISPAFASPITADEYISDVAIKSEQSDGFYGGFSRIEWKTSGDTKYNQSANAFTIGAHKVSVIDSSLSTRTTIELTTGSGDVKKTVYDPITNKSSQTVQKENVGVIRILGDSLYSATNKNLKYIGGFGFEQNTMGGNGASFRSNAIDLRAGIRYDDQKKFVEGVINYPIWNKVEVEGQKVDGSARIGYSFEMGLSKIGNGSTGVSISYEREGFGTFNQLENTTKSALNLKVRGKFN